MFRDVCDRQKKTFRRNVERNDFKNITIYRSRDWIKNLSKIFFK